MIPTSSPEKIVSTTRCPDVTGSHTTPAAPLRIISPSRLTWLECTPNPTPPVSTIASPPARGTTVVVSAGAPRPGGRTGPSRPPASACSRPRTSPARGRTSSPSARPRRPTSRRCGSPPPPPSARLPAGGPGPGAGAAAWMPGGAGPGAEAVGGCAGDEGPAQMAAGTHVATSAARTRQDRIGGGLLGSGPGPQWTADDARGNPAG